MVYVDLSDDIPDGVHFNMTMDSFDCDAYLDVRVYNRTDGQNNQMFKKDKTTRIHKMETTGRLCQQKIS